MRVPSFLSLAAVLGLSACSAILTPAANRYDNNLIRQRYCVIAYGE